MTQATNSWIFYIFTILTAAITLLIVYLKRVYSYWHRRGFKTAPNVSYLFGNFKQTFLVKESFIDMADKLYKSTNEPFIGIYTILRPVLLIRDPELIQSILIKDFSHFTDRGIHCNEDYDALSATLLALPGPKWKTIRGKLTPAFSSGKLKAMFSTLVDCGSTLQNYLEKLADKKELLDVREISACFTTNIIASVGFGIDVDSINNPGNEFRECGRQIFEPNLRNIIRLLLTFISPKMMEFLRIRSVPPKVETFLKSIIEQNLEYREKNNVVRKDLFQLLIQLRNTGTVASDGQWHTEIKDDENKKTMTLNEIAAQTFIFFMAGFETSSTTLMYCLFELAKNPEIQENVRNEINSILDQHKGEVSYDSVSEMKYLDNCIDETLRKYPVVPTLLRRCVKDYVIPGTNQVIQKDIGVFIPVFSMQRDEQYYEDPNTFNPDRFNEENSVGKNQINRPYYPFGDGPRNCIGMRLGKMQTKVGLVVMLQKYKFDLEEQLKGCELSIDPKTLLLAPDGGLKLHVSKR